MADKAQFKKSRDDSDVNGSVLKTSSDDEKNILKMKRL